MSLFKSDNIYSYEQLSSTEEKAWKLYCKESAGMISAKDFWQQLPLETKNNYLNRVKYDQSTDTTKSNI